MDEPEPAPQTPLRYGWTTGACATAAAKAAYTALLTGDVPDPVTITLPGGETPAFALARTERTSEGVSVGIVKDAGDDPDVTHGALILATVMPAPDGSGIVFRAGSGVGTVTRPGLALAPGEPAINPVPRRMIAEAIAEVAGRFGGSGDVVVEIAVPGGERLAERTLNARLGILGGLSILGTTGIVVPYSCAAWIHSIHRGVDVARASGLTHIAAATGATSEAAVKARHGLDDVALIDMGDFVGGFLKYVRMHPVDRVTIAGGFAKMTKLGQGLLDLHSKRGAVDLDWLADRAADTGGDPPLVAAIRQANSAAEALQRAAIAGLDLGGTVAQSALAQARTTLGTSEIALDVAIFDRDGRLVGQAPRS